MEAILYKAMKPKLIVIIIALILFFIPFFWLKNGEMDLGGDSIRLYFYDPISFIKSSSIYSITTEGKGLIEPNYYYLPYVALLAIFRSFLSTTSVINLFNGIKLSMGFLGIFLIVRELLQEYNLGKEERKTYLPAIIAGIFYVVSFGSINMSSYWNRAITSHNQVFLNPTFFYLLLKYLLSHQKKFLWIAILLSFIFAPSFGMTSAPPFFAFYPLAMLFLFIYTKLFSHKPIPWKGVIIGVLLFLGVQTFQYLGQGVSLFDRGSFSNVRVFLNSDNQGIGYFTAVSSQGKAVLNLLLPSESKMLQWTSFIAPLIVLIGFFLNKTKRKKYLLISLFFLLTLFLTTANITNIGYEGYRRLFYIPGFSMFRVFFTQWLYVHIFFYALLLGFAIHCLITKLKPFYDKILFFIVLIPFVITSLPLLSGALVNKSIIRGSDNLRVLFKMDPRYEETLGFIRTLPDDGKFLVLPLTDFFYQLIGGVDRGAYEGPSTITHLLGKYSFVGYQHFGYESYDPAPYAEDIMKYAREKNYNRLLQIFATLNIRYILHNTDSNIFENSFSTGGPYIYMSTSLPKTQNEYQDFVTHFPVREIYKNGPYIIYEMDKSAYNPTIFIPNGVYQSDKLSFDDKLIHSVFINEKVCQHLEFRSICQDKYLPPKVNLEFKMINLTLYEVHIRVDEPFDHMLLVMQHTFHKGWKLISNNTVIAENTHIPVNGYANGWLINNKDLPQTRDFVVYLKLDPQKYFWYGAIITLVSLLLVFILLIRSFTKKIIRKS